MHVRPDWPVSDVTSSLKRPAGSWPRKPDSFLNAAIMFPSGSILWSKSSFAWITIYLLGSSRVAALTLICNVVCAAPSAQSIKMSRLVGLMRTRAGSHSDIAWQSGGGGGADNRFKTSSVSLRSGIAAIFSIGPAGESPKSGKHSRRTRQQRHSRNLNRP